MQLAELTKVIQPKKISGNIKQEILGLVYDSRQARPKSLFVAIKGQRYDGHNFIRQAVKLGARAVVVEKEQKLPAEIAQIVVADSRLALGQLAARFYDYPSKKLNLVGVTGTNGKTTVSTVLASIFKEAPAKVGLIGTIAYFINGKKFHAEHTTPEALDLQQILQRMVSEQVHYACLEVSSHALELQRTTGCFFKAAVFTNLSHDHLDFHQTMAKYFSAKSRLFNDQEYNVDFKIVNIDDPYGQKLQQLAANAVTYGLKKGDYRVEKINQVSADGTKFTVLGPAKFKVEVDSQLIGYFNIYNLLAAVATAATLGFSKEQIENGIKKLTYVPGRFAPVNCGQDFYVIVDYAHTPDGLQKVIESSRQLGVNRIITVFGCGGDRDKAKRPLMGKIAAELSDYVIVTSDNPRSEDPQTIINEIVQGISQNGCPHQTIVSREEAIATAINLAQPNDLVLLAGKGHEDYQIIGGKVIPFDDREVAESVLKKVMTEDVTPNHS